MRLSSFHAGGQEPISSVLANEDQVILGCKRTCRLTELHLDLSWVAGGLTFLSLQTRFSCWKPFMCIYVSVSHSSQAYIRSWPVQVPKATETSTPPIPCSSQEMVIGRPQILCVCGCVWQWRQERRASQGLRQQDVTEAGGCPSTCVVVTMETPACGLHDIRCDAGIAGCRLHASAGELVDELNGLIPKPDGKHDQGGTAVTPWAAN